MDSFVEMPGMQVFQQAQQNLCGAGYDSTLERTHEL